MILAAPPAEPSWQKERREEPGLAEATPGAPADPTGLILCYLNRLSDLLFALARQANRADGVDEKTWQP